MMYTEKCFLKCFCGDETLVEIIDSEDIGMDGFDNGKNKK